MFGGVFVGYDIHITRADDWIESPENPISLEELKEYFSRKSGFEYSKVISISRPCSISVEGEFFIWTNNDSKVTFSYSMGCIDVSYVNDEVIEKMKEIASDLNAKVQGDEGEFY